MKKILPCQDCSVNLLLCSMQGNSVLLVKTLEKNFQNHPYGQPVLTFDKRQIRFPKSILWAVGSLRQLSQVLFYS